MPRYAYVHACHTHLHNWSILSCYSSTATFNDCYNELMPYTVLANSYWVSVYNVYINTKATPINDNGYSCHVTAVELVYPIICGPYHATSY